MKIRYNHKRSINASTDKDYASLKGTDFKKAKAILEKDGFKEHEYGDKDNNNGYAVYRKGDKEVELTYKWEKGTRKDQYNAGKVLDVYVDEDINAACGGKKSVKASNEGRSDLIYVIMVNGDPVAKGSYDAMVKKSYTYNFPVQMLKFPKAKLNSLIKMAKGAHRPDPLKFAVNRFINDNTSEYDSLNASTRHRPVKATRHNDSDYTVMYEIYIDDKASDLEFDTEDEAYDYAVNKIANENPAASIKIYKNFYDYYGKSKELSFVDAEWCDTVTASTRRRPVRAARTLEILTYDELTPEQQQYVIDNWSNMPKLAEVIYEWHSEDEMFVYNDEVQFIADKYANAHNLGINPDKIYWQSNSQGPYPEWELSQVFDDYSFEDADGEWHDVEFYGRGTTVQSSCFAYDELIPADQAIVDDITSAAQQFIDDVWQLINDICQSYPDDEWVQQTMEANPDAFEFTISANGEVKYF